VGDAPDRVITNRGRFASRLGGARPVYLRQVHGVRCVELGMDSVPPADGLEADASVTPHAGLACAVMVADCLPVLLSDTEGRAVAAAHAGWRGLAAGVLAGSVQALRRAAADPRAEVLAWLGPCIGPAAFEVGDEVRQAFVAADAGAAMAFRPAAEGKWWANLPGLARRQLVAQGVTRVYGNDGSPAWCTVTQSAWFFSHRRDTARLGASGRFAAAIWRYG
jgi:polyphenol oxidase